VDAEGGAPEAEGRIKLKDPESMFFERSSIRRPIVEEFVLNSCEDSARKHT